MSITIPYWAFPLIITIIALYLGFKDDRSGGPYCGADPLRAAAGIIISLLSWLIWAVIIMIIK